MANIREMTAGDLDRVIALLRQTAGVSVARRGLKKRR